MKRINKGGKLLVSFLMTYVGIILISVFSVLILFHQLSENFQHEVNMQYYRNAANIQYEMDKALKTIWQGTHSLGWDTRINTLSRAKQPFEAKTIYTIHEMCQQLRTHQTMSLSSSDTVVFLEGSDSILSSDGCANSLAYYYQHATKYDMTYEEWIQLITTNNRNKFIPVIIGSGEDSSYYLFAVETVVKSSLVHIVSMIDLNALAKQVSGYEFLNQFYILDKENKLIYSENSQMPVCEYASAPEMAPDKPTLTIEETENGKMVVISISSNIEDWKYIWEIPVAVFFQKVSNLYIPLTLIILAIILIGAILTYLFMQENYRPMKRINAIIYEKIRMKDAYENEYHLIESVLVEMINNNQRITDTMIYQKEMLRENALKNLLVSPLEDPVKQEKLLENLNIELAKSRY